MSDATKGSLRSSETEGVKARSAANPGVARNAPTPPSPRSPTLSPGRGSTPSPAPKPRPKAAPQIPPRNPALLNLRARSIAREAPSLYAGPKSDARQRVEPVKAKIHVYLKPGVLDPQGAAVAGALHNMGYDEVTAARQGKLIELDLKGDDLEAARKRVDEMCAKLLSNPVIESYSIELE